VPPFSILTPLPNSGPHPVLKHYLDRTYYVMTLSLVLLSWEITHKCYHDPSLSQVC
jgi:hypothetical protein